VRGVEIPNPISSKLKIRPWLLGGCSIPLIPVALVGSLILNTKVLGITVVQNLINFPFLMGFVIITRGDQDRWLGILVLARIGVSGSKMQF
jgi:hypothetical protein